MCSPSAGSVIVIIVMAVAGCCGAFVWISLLIGCTYLVYDYCRPCKHQPRHKRPGERSLRRIRGDIDVGDLDNFHSSATTLIRGDDQGALSSTVSESSFTVKNVRKTLTPADQQAKESCIKTCAYRQVCERFLKTLSISDTYFDPNPKYNMCYCENCLKGRKDKRVYNRGIPPTKYAVPIGWTRFSLRVPPLAEANDAFNKWHVAFHGTASQNVKKILDTGHLVLPGNLIAGGTEVNQPKGHYTKNNRPAGFDVDQIFVSPSIKYSGHEAYARATNFRDTLTMKNYKCRVAFQVLIKPDSYSVGAETIGAGRNVIDSEFENSILEWSTKEYGTTILYGLLIKAE